ncbi:hypothetical protein C7B76_08115 [filamentous cyanobacterium CCP2]|nr:hypothetical protein C7B76_08115 [filamentous cyanobacterium CCP2]
MQSIWRKPWFYVALIFLGFIMGWLVSAWLQIKSSFATDKERFDASLEIIRIIVTIFGGVVLFLNFRTSNRNAELGESRLITERFSKAVEQLGNENIHVRLGGIFALEKIAEEAPDKYHWTVMEVLTSYLQEKSPLIEKEKSEPSSDPFSSDMEHEKFKKKSSSTYLTPPVEKDVQATRTQYSKPIVEKDVQAALTVIGRRDETKDRGKRLDLSRVDLSGAILDDNAKLNNANLKAAKLVCSNLCEAKLINANLQAAKLARSNLRGAKLMNAELEHAEFNLANLFGADLTGANLSQATLNQANLKGATLNNSILILAKIIRASFDDANLTNADLKGAVLDSSSFKGSRLNGVNLSDADLTNANFLGAKELTSRQVQCARNWDKAVYDEDLRQQLNLSPYYDEEIRMRLGLPARFEISELLLIITFDLIQVMPIDQLSSFFIFLNKELDRLIHQSTQ